MWDVTLMPKPLRISLVCLHICAALYGIFGIALTYFAYLADPAKALPGASRIMGISIGIFFVLFAVTIELIVKGLKNRRYWAWIGAIIFCALSIPGVLILPGILGLRGLLVRETRILFQKPVDFPGIAS